MYDREDILKGRECPPEFEDNLAVLLDRLNSLECDLGVHLPVNSGFRTWEEHVEIYRKKALKKGVPFDINKVPKKSHHLDCSAADLDDHDGDHKKTVKANEYDILVKCGLYMEAESATPTWLHVQTKPPASGKREFLP